MLRINLLPIRQLKKRARAKLELWGLAGILCLIIAIAVGISLLQLKDINMLESEIKAITTKKNSYNDTLKKIEQLKKESEELARKTEVIKKIKVDSSLTVRILDEVANSIDSQRMWLDSLQQQTNSLSLSGVALDNQTIAQFMDKLKASKFVKDVSLANSSLKVVSGRNLKSFSLNCSVSQPASKEKSEAKSQTPPKTK